MTRQKVSSLCESFGNGDSVKLHRCTTEHAVEIVNYTIGNVERANLHKHADREEVVWIMKKMKMGRKQKQKDSAPKDLGRTQWV